MGSLAIGGILIALVIIPTIGTLGICGPWPAGADFWAKTHGSIRTRIRCPWTRWSGTRLRRHVEDLITGPRC